MACFYVLLIFSVVTLLSSICFLQLTSEIYLKLLLKMFNLCHLVEVRKKTVMKTVHHQQRHHLQRVQYLTVSHLEGMNILIYLKNNNDSD